MDTLIYNAENYELKKLAEIAVNVSIIGVLSLCQVLMPIHASNIKVAQVTAPDFDTGQLKARILNEISPEVRQKNFDKMIKDKYPKALITDVTSGVKHIKLTKYYSGRPVRINVVEADLKLADDFELTPALSSDTTLKSRRTISTIAKNSNAIIALNGTYFKPQTGVPLGTLMINEKMYTGPVYDRVALGIFDDGFEVDTIIRNISLINPNFVFEPGETLIFFDEVQKCPEIVTAIKFLVEEGSYRYVLSGSLLGVELRDLRSVPVGYLEVKDMYPLDFEEFLICNNVNDWFT